MTLLDEILQEVPSEEEIARRIAPYGDTDRGIRKSKPDGNGLIQWVWRWARFHTGEDTHMPVSARFWLKDWLEEEGFIPEYDPNSIGDQDRMGITSDVENELEETVANVIREQFGESDLEGARRWKKAGLF